MIKIDGFFRTGPDNISPLMALNILDARLNLSLSMVPEQKQFLTSKLGLLNSSQLNTLASSPDVGKMNKVLSRAELVIIKAGPAYRIVERSRSGGWHQIFMPHPAMAFAGAPLSSFQPSNDLVMFTEGSPKSEKAAPASISKALLEILINNNLISKDDLYFKHIELFGHAPRSEGAFQKVAWEYYLENYANITRIMAPISSKGLLNPFTELDPENAMVNLGRSVIKKLPTESQKVDGIAAYIHTHIAWDRMMDIPENVSERTQRFILCILFIRAAETSGLKAGMVLTENGHTNWAMIDGERIEIDLYDARSRYKAIKDVRGNEMSRRDFYKAAKVPPIDKKKADHSPLPAVQIIYEWHYLNSLAMEKSGKYFDAERTALIASELVPCDEICLFIEGLAATLNNRTNIRYLTGKFMNDELPDEVQPGFAELLSMHPSARMAMNIATKDFGAIKETPVAAAEPAKMPMMEEDEKTAWGDLNRYMDGSNSFPYSLKELGLHYPYFDSDVKVLEVAASIMSRYNSGQEKVEALINEFLPELLAALAGSGMKDSFSQRWVILEASCLFVMMLRSNGIPSGVQTNYVTPKENLDNLNKVPPPVSIWMKTDSKYYKFSLSDFGVMDSPLPTMLYRKPVIEEFKDGDTLRDRPNKVFSYYHYIRALCYQEQVREYGSGSNERKNFSRKFEDDLINATMIDPDNSYFRFLLLATATEIVYSYGLDMTRSIYKYVLDELHGNERQVMEDLIDNHPVIAYAVEDQKKKFKQKD